MACEKCGFGYLKAEGNKLVCPNCGLTKRRDDVIVFKTRQELQQEIEECHKKIKELEDRIA